MADLRIIQGLRTIGDMLVEALQAELTAQGHDNTGAGVESIAYAVQVFGNLHQLDLSFNKYLVYQDKGIKPDRIPFSEGSGAKKSKYIQALMKWVTERGLVTSQKQAKGMAFAIAKKHKKEGMPTAGAYAHSFNGRRLGFFTDLKEFGQVPEMVDNILTETVFAIMEDMINDVQNYITKSQSRAA